SGGGRCRSLHITDELIDLALGVTAQGGRSGLEGRPVGRIQEQPALKVEVAHLGFKLLLLARDRAQLITDPRAGGKASAGAEKQTHPGEGSDPDADSVR